MGSQTSGKTAGGGKKGSSRRTPNVLAKSVTNGTGEKTTAAAPERRGSSAKKRDADGTAARRGRHAGAQRDPGAAPGASNGHAAAASGAVARPTIPPPAATPTDGAGDGARLAPVKARPTRSERAFAEARAQEIDDVCAAWAAIVAERMAADQQFAESFEQFQKRPRDLRALFLWDQLHAAESHVALVNAVIAKHLDGRRADPFAILADLRLAQRKLAVAYAVNAFLAVLNQMSPSKPKWLAFEDLDPRMAVLALAHQTLEYALESGRIESPGDLTERILEAAQHESVWTGARDTSDRTLAACAATAAFFRSIGAEELSSIDEVVALYEDHARKRA